jgi:hypothetical protein
MVVSVTWQRGVLGVRDGREEDRFVEEVCRSLEPLLVGIARSDLGSKRIWWKGVDWHIFVSWDPHVRILVAVNS